MSKEILFSYETGTDRFKAECADISDGIVWGASKYLTNQEIDGLSEVVDFKKVSDEVTTFHRYTVEALEFAFETSELDETYFQEMYYQFIKESN